MTDVKTEYVPLEIFKIFSDKSRLDIAGILREGESYPELIASRLGLTAATVCFHLKKMEAAGVVSSRRDQFYIMYRLCNGILDVKLGDLIVKSDADGNRKYREAVYSSFIKYGRLVSIPVQLKKREIILRRIALDFDSGRTYTEREVNEIIKVWHDDYCTLRREMINLGIMERDHEIYKLK